MGKAAGFGMGSTLWSMETKQVLVSLKLFMADDIGIFYENGIVMLFFCS
jgi:hypothetical protein